MGVGFFSVILFGMLLLQFRSAAAATTVGGNIGTNTVWAAANGPYVVTSNLTLIGSASLTVEEGVTVYFNAGTQLTVLNGSLLVSGTAADPVLFTSWRDTSGGTPVAGDWGGIHFLDGTLDSATIIEYATIRYGATTTLASASPTFNHCRFESNSGYALSLDLASFPHGAGNSAVKNDHDAIRVPAGEIITSGAWDLTSIPYYMEGDLSIGAAPRITTMQPSYLEQGSSVAAIIAGTRLSGVKAVTFGNPGITAAIQPGATDTSIPVQITADKSAPFGVANVGLSVAAGDATLATGITIIPPTPHIDGIVPGTIYAGHSETMELTGKNFTANSIVTIDGNDIQTSFISASTLRISPSVATSGTKSVQVKLPDPRAAGSFIISNTAALNVIVPSFTITPTSVTLRQGEMVPLTLGIPFAAPFGGVTAQITSTNTQSVTVPATVTIPEGGTSAVINASAVNGASTRDVTVDINVSQFDWICAKTTLTVRPQPTVNLTPTTLLSGQGFSFFLTISLTDPAPAGGLTMALSASPANVLSFPATVTVPEGATQAQVTVVNSGTGSSTITATPAAGKGFIAGDICAVTVKPVQTYNIGPTLSPSVGVQVGTPPVPIVPPISVSPLFSNTVGVAVGAVINGVIPDRAQVGTQNLVIRVYGSGLAGATDISFAPADGITVRAGTLTRATDGSYVEVTVDIAADAATTPRVAVLRSGTTTASPASPGAAIFQLTYPAPEIGSLIPNSSVPGTFTLQINGRNLFNASAVTFEPPDGIAASSTITVSSAGTLASLPVTVDPAAAKGRRLVRITTPGGTSSATMAPANAFGILSAAGDGFTPVVAPQVGVIVPTTPVTEENRTYSPFTSLPVGISVGPVMNGIIPGSGAIGSTDLVLRITGKNLAAVDSVAFYPVTGITVTSLTSAGDGSFVDVHIAIAADAPTSARSVILKAGAYTVPPAAPGSNIFRVTLPQPLLYGISPIRGMAGSSFTMTLSGTLLSGATNVSFIPPDGITVANPPTVSSGGAVATVGVTLAANAPTTARIVTITTPGGTTTDTPSVANTFTVTSEAGKTYTPVIANQIGVTVATAPPTTAPSTYNPIISSQVGISIPFTPPPPNSNLVIGAMVSPQVGVIVGASVSSVSLTRMEPGTSASVTITGVALDNVTSLKVAPAAGITVGALTPSADGTTLTVQLTADITAPRGLRALVPMVGSTAVSAPVRGTNQIYVGMRPSVISVSPILQTVGNTFTLTINGTSLDGATTVRFEPMDGITVVNPPAINAAGTQATVTVIIDGMAPGGQRIVVMDGPYGSSDNTPGANNIFNVSRPVVQAPASVKTASQTLPKPLTEAVAGWPADPRLLAFADGVMPAITAWRQLPVPVFHEPLLCLNTIGHHDEKEVQQGVEQFPLQVMASSGRGYRGPPKRLGA